MEKKINQKKNNFLWGIIFALITFVVFLVFLYWNGNEDSNPGAELENGQYFQVVKYDDIYIYDLHEGSDITFAKQHCDLNEGTFSECVMPCSRQTDFCLEMCANACLFDIEDIDVEEEYQFDRQEILFTNPPHWVVYDNNEIGFSMNRPSVVVARTNDEDLSVIFQYGEEIDLGEDYYISDGLWLYIQKQNKEKNVDLQSVAESVREEHGFLGIGVSDMQEIVIDGKKGYLFREGQALETMHVFVPHTQSDAYLYLQYQVNDPLFQGYEVALMRMLETFTIY